MFLVDGLTGHMRNIYFPFDILSDTPIDVANEMVKELEITDRDPEEIAEVIAQEISTLVPDWNGGMPDEEDEADHHVYNCNDDVEDGTRHPFYYMSSPNSSSQGSVHGTSFRYGEAYQAADWLGGMLSVLIDVCLMFFVVRYRSFRT